MTTVQFLTSFISWLQADPFHISVLASALAALTPTPSPNTLAGRIYKVLDLLALNFLHAKETGVQLPEVAQQVATLLAQQNQPAPAAAPPAIAFPPAPKDPQ